MNQQKAIQFSKLVDAKTLRACIKQGGSNVEEHTAALEIQKLAIAEHKLTGVWPDRNAIGAAYFAKLAA